ncbi:hypothetical protein MMC25_005140 [Agyrium rufum]|nr:hypothetical protein [Agyrium rufum]
MAPSSGHLLVPKAMKIFKFALSNAQSFVKTKYQAINTSLNTSTATSSLELIPVRVHASSQPLHPLAVLRQARSGHITSGRWYSSTTRTFIRSTVRNATTTAFYSTRPLKANLPVSRISRTIAAQGKAPFASSLRPNLTGGALPRSAGGYGLGGAGKQGIRHFSHVPSSQAHVVQNVSAAVRAFWTEGNRARFAGLEKDGRKKFEVVSVRQDEMQKKTSKAFQEMGKMMKKGEKVRGARIEFNVGPVVTALAPSGTATTPSAETVTLQTPQVLDVLTSDFARHLKTLAAVLADLNKISARLGDLPITYGSSSQDGTGKSSTIQVHFPGCDAASVEALCLELGLRRGIVREDEAWKFDRDVEMALLFPFADDNAKGFDETAEETEDAYLRRLFAFPAEVARMDARKTPKGLKKENVEWEHMLSPITLPSRSASSLSEDDTSLVRDYEHVSAQQTPFGESALAIEEQAAWGAENASGSASLIQSHDGSFAPEQGRLGSLSSMSHRTSEADFEGLEGIYRFLRECEGARRL